MLSVRAGTAVVALLALGGCGGSPTRAWPPAHRATTAPPEMLLTAADGELCVQSELEPPPCVPAAASAEPVVSATLARVDPETDVVIVLTRADVVVHGLGATASRVTVQLDGQELVAWLRTLPRGAAVVCVSYRAPDASGRVVVHRTRTVAATEPATVEPGTDDGC